MGVAILQTADDITTGSTVIAIKASPGKRFLGRAITEISAYTGICPRFLYDWGSCG